jgi:predicted N-acetyltransferase YhbS
MDNHYKIINAQTSDLDQINAVIESAVMTWNLPERVKRLSLSTYFYNEIDLQHFTIHVALEGDTIIGLVACDTTPHTVSDSKQALLIHGLYVSPEHHHKGVGTLLFQSALQLARQQQLDGLTVKAQADAKGFFEAQGMHKLEVEDTKKDYELRYWLALD